MSRLDSNPYMCKNIIIMNAEDNYDICAEKSPSGRLFHFTANLQFNEYLLKFSVPLMFATATGTSFRLPQLLPLGYSSNDRDIHPQTQISSV